MVLEKLNALPIHHPCELVLEGEGVRRWYTRLRLTLIRTIPCVHAQVWPVHAMPCVPERHAHGDCIPHERALDHMSVDITCRTLICPGCPNTVWSDASHMLRNYEWSDSLMSHPGQYSVDINSTKPHVYKDPLLHPGGADYLLYAALQINQV